MQTTLLYLHSYVRWILLVLLLITIVKAFIGWKKNELFSNSDKIRLLSTMIIAHTTLLIGIYQVFAGRFGILNTELEAGQSFMKDRFYRFYWMEHPLLMVLAIIVITIAYKTSKKAIANDVKMKKIFFYSFFALIFILAAIPWPFRAAIGRPLLP